MRIIKGFIKGKSLLSRRATALSFPVSPSLKKRLQSMFGTGDPEQAVRIIIEDVRKNGDAALIKLTEQIDGIKLTSLEIAQNQFAQAQKQVDTELLSAIKLAAERIRAFHEVQKKNICRETAGEEWGQLIRPLERVGIYVPGGTASYPSTVLMTAIPAKAAGVKEIIMVTPPKADGSISSLILTAAEVAGVDRIFSVGGAQAVAALAYGTELVPKVDKICGPGNMFVVLAKKLVYGTVAIDGLQGPSEVLIIADETADPVYCAADVLAQAEHDPLASAVIVTTSEKLAQSVNSEIEKQLSDLPRQKTISPVLERGTSVIVNTMEEAIELVNLYAPEHLLLMVEDARRYLPSITNAGCIISGAKATVVMGDYIAGPSHVLPTGGTARFSSPLNVLDFIKLINTINVSEAMVQKLGKPAALLAHAEGLDAHARAVERRL